MSRAAARPAPTDRWWLARCRRSRRLRSSAAAARSAVSAGSRPDDPARSASASAKWRRRIRKMACGKSPRTSRSKAWSGLATMDGRNRLARARVGTFAPDGRTLDGPVAARRHVPRRLAGDAPAVAELCFERALPDFMGPVFDGRRTRSAHRDRRDFEIALRRPSPFVLEALETCSSEAWAKNPAGTGPFEPAGPDVADGIARQRALLSRPPDRRSDCASSTYPTVRAAWAEMLRDHLDMLYDVGTDALDSLERSTNDLGLHLRAPLSVRARLQYSASADASRSAEFARRSNPAIDRDAIVREGAERPRRRLVRPDLAASLGVASATCRQFSSILQRPRRCCAPASSCTSPVWYPPTTSGSRSWSSDSCRRSA